VVGVAAASAVVPIAIDIGKVACSALCSVAHSQASQELSWWIDLKNEGLKAEASSQRHGSTVQPLTPFLWFWLWMAEVYARRK
jgi:hypothetical protein